MKRRRQGSEQERYKPAKTWRLRVVTGIVPDAGGAHRVEFQDDFSIQVHAGSGRSDLLYAMKPYDTRLEQRSPGAETRREYQYAALLAVLAHHQASFFVDRDGDVVAKRVETVTADDILRGVVTRAKR